jgi:hypothetical protein
MDSDSPQYFIKHGLGIFSFTYLIEYLPSPARRSFLSTMTQTIVTTGWEERVSL